MPTEEQLKELRKLEQELDIAHKDRIDNSLMSKLTQPIQQPEERKPILVLDFDGVLHSYTSGWKGANVVSDDPVTGAQEFCLKAVKKFEVIVVSSRCNQPGGSEAVFLWLVKHNFPAGMRVSEDGTKPAAFITLDDRAMTFDGHWPDIDLMLQFQPWYKRGV